MPSFEKEFILLPGIGKKRPLKQKRNADPSVIYITDGPFCDKNII